MISIADHETVFYMFFLFIAFFVADQIIVQEISHSMADSKNKNQWSKS